MLTEHRKITYSKFLPHISIAWLAAGILLGHLLATIIPIENLNKISSYTKVSHLTSDSQLATAITVALIALMPLAIILFRSYGFEAIYISSKGRIFLLTLSLIVLPLAFDVIPISEGTKHYMLVRTLTTYFDWFGSTLSVFLFMWCFAFFASLAASRTGSTREIQ